MISAEWCDIRCHLDKVAGTEVGEITLRTPTDFLNAPPRSMHRPTVCVLRFSIPAPKYPNDGSTARLSRKAPKGRRHRGPRYPGWKALRPTSPLYEEVMYYWAYCLEDTEQSRSSRATRKVRNFFKRMEFTVEDHYFSGEDPIRVLDVLAR